MLNTNKLTFTSLFVIFLSQQSAQAEIERLFTTAQEREHLEKMKDGTSYLPEQSLEKEKPVSPFSAI